MKSERKKRNEKKAAEDNYFKNRTMGLAQCTNIKATALYSGCAARARRPALSGA
jgi:hypothetical protein